MSAAEILTTALLGAIVLGGMWLMNMLFGVIGAVVLFIFVAPIIWLVLRQAGGGGETTQRQSKGARDGGD